MGREYLRGWRIFKDKIHEIIPHFQKLAAENRHNLEGSLNALRGLGFCKLD